MQFTSHEKDYARKENKVKNDWKQNNPKYTEYTVTTDK